MITSMKKEMKSLFGIVPQKNSWQIYGKNQWLLTCSPVLPKRLCRGK